MDFIATRKLTATEYSSIVNHGLLYSQKTVSKFAVHSMLPGSSELSQNSIGVFFHDIFMKFFGVPCMAFDNERFEICYDNYGGGLVKFTCHYELIVSFDYTISTLICHKQEGMPVFSYAEAEIERVLAEIAEIDKIKALLRTTK